MCASLAVSVCIPADLIMSLYLLILFHKLVSGCKYVTKSVLNIWISSFHFTLTLQSSPFLSFPVLSLQPSCCSALSLHWREGQGYSDGFRFCQVCSWVTDSVPSQCAVSANFERAFLAVRLETHAHKIERHLNSRYLLLTAATQLRVKDSSASV